MKTCWPLLAASLLALAAADFALAKHYRHRAPAAPVGADTQSSFAPARIIQVRPGVFISSYDCITDDGYGRWRPCSDSRGQ